MDLETCPTLCAVAVTLAFMPAPFFHDTLPASRTP